MSAVASDDNLAAELLPAFISEANEQITALEQLLLELEEAPDDRELLDALFRCAHTIKGSAGLFGLDAVVSFTHHVETLLSRVREGVLALTPAMSSLLLQSNDMVRLLIDAAEDASVDTAESVARRAELVTRLIAASGDTAVRSADVEPVAVAAPVGIARWNVSVAFGTDTFRNGMDPLTLLNYVASLGTVTSIACDTETVPALEQLDAESCHLAFTFQLETERPRDDIEQAFSFVRDDCELSIEADRPAIEPVAAADAAPVTAITPVERARPRSAATAGASSDDSGFIRVHANRLDEVINLLGELVIASAGASLLARASRSRAQIEANDQVTRLIEGIRNSTLKLRMVPIGETFSRFRRVVRDTAAELGKDVLLEIVGGDTELDKAMVERIADPLMHLVRNALDHGLETPEQRSAAGKAAQGKLTLTACHESGSVLISITDDGRGIQRDRVLARARERGLVAADATPADADILKLIFEAGFSTAEKVTNLSGRGVGMDVVRSNIEALRGTVTLSSEQGQGSRIDIRLPLTLAIIDGFLIGIGSSRFIIPLESVVEVIEKRPALDELDGRGRGIVALRGQVLPVVSLRGLYQLESAEPERMSVVVVKAGGKTFGLMVDQLLGQYQTVIKPLGRMLGSLRGVSGSSILGSGEVALILDVNSLATLAVSARPSPSTHSNVVPLVRTLS